MNNHNENNELNSKSKVSYDARQEYSKHLVEQEACFRRCIQVGDYRGAFDALYSYLDMIAKYITNEQEKELDDLIQTLLSYNYKCFFGKSFQIGELNRPKELAITIHLHKLHRLLLKYSSHLLLPMQSNEELDLNEDDFFK